MEKIPNADYILIIGSGARETIFIKKLLNDSKSINKDINIICLGNNNNPYINEKCNLYIHEKFSKEFFIDFLNNIIKKIYNNKIKFAFIGPELPLELEFSDMLEESNIPCIGPLSNYAQIETSKTYARNFIKYAGLNEYSPLYVVLDNKVNKENIINNLSNFNNFVIKKDGLCGGKGVLVQGIDFQNKEDVIDDLYNSIKQNEKILIEDKLIGEEFSLMSITDGNGNVKHFPPIQDYKRLDEGDKGPNTGGMGCVIDRNNSLPFLNQEDIVICENINNIIIDNLNKNGVGKKNKIGYRGILYGSFIKQRNNKIKIIEFNSRFGDPECLIALSLLKNNLYNICNEIINKNLKSNLLFDNSSMLAVYLVPRNYPSFTESEIINIDNVNDTIKNNIIYGNIEEKNGNLYNLSSRTMIYLKKQNYLSDCFEEIYNDILLINSKNNLKYRKDIGLKYLFNKNI